MNTYGLHSLLVYYENGEQSQQEKKNIILRFLQAPFIQKVVGRYRIQRRCISRQMNHWSGTNRNRTPVYCPFANLWSRKRKLNSDVFLVEASYSKPVPLLSSHHSNALQKTLNRPNLLGPPFLTPRGNCAPLTSAPRVENRLSWANMSYVGLGF